MKGKRLGGREGGTDRKRVEEDRMRGEVMVERESNLRTPQVVSALLSSPPHCACKQYQTKNSTHITHYLYRSSTSTSSVRVHVWARSLASGAHMQS